MAILNEATAQKQAATDIQINANTAQVAVLTSQLQNVITSNASLSVTVSDMIAKMDAILEARAAKTARTDGSSQP